MKLWEALEKSEYVRLTNWAKGMYMYFDTDKELYDQYHQHVLLNQDLFFSDNWECTYMGETFGIALAKYSKIRRKAWTKNNHVQLDSNGFIVLTPLVYLTSEDVTANDWIPAEQS